MAEPQPNTANEESRAKTNASSGARAEPRSFDQQKAEKDRSDLANAAVDLATQAAAPVIEGGRQMAEQSRRAGRQVADAWRQAVDPLLAMQYDFSQWFDDAFRHTFGFRSAPGAHPLRPMGHLNAASFFGLPPADLRETERAHLLAIELPGLTREDIDLSISGDSLMVSGHKSEETEDATASYRVNERRYGRFERVFPLPSDVDRGRIEAHFRDGVLRVTLPKRPTAAPPRSRIEVR